MSKKVAIRWLTIEDLKQFSGQLPFSLACYLCEERCIINKTILCNSAFSCFSLSQKRNLMKKLVDLDSLFHDYNKQIVSQYIKQFSICTLKIEEIEI